MQNKRAMRNSSSSLAKIRRDFMLLPTIRLGRFWWALKHWLVRTPQVEPFSFLAKKKPKAIDTGSGSNWERKTRNYAAYYSPSTGIWFFFPKLVPAYDLRNHEEERNCCDEENNADKDRSNHLFFASSAAHDHSRSNYGINDAHQKHYRSLQTTMCHQEDTDQSIMFFCCHFNTSVPNIVRTNRNERKISYVAIIAANRVQPPMLLNCRRPGRVPRHRVSLPAASFHREES